MSPVPTISVLTPSQIWFPCAAMKVLKKWVGQWQKFVYLNTRLAKQYKQNLCNIKPKAEKIVVWFNKDWEVQRQYECYTMQLQYGIYGDT